MTPRPPSCWTCHCYDKENRKCTIGKANPPRKHMAQTLAELLGPEAICMKSPFREPLIMRMRYPNTSQPRPQASFEYDLEIEILDEPS